MSSKGIILITSNMVGALWDTGTANSSGTPDYILRFSEVYVLISLCLTTSSSVVLLKFPTLFCQQNYPRINLCHFYCFITYEMQSKYLDLCQTSHQMCSIWKIEIRPNWNLWKYRSQFQHTFSFVFSHTVSKKDLI